MASTRVAAFKWEKLLSKVAPADARGLNVLRAHANELTANHSKFSAAPVAIDFAGYKKKLRFTSPAVDALEKAYQARKLPQYHAKLPEFEVKKRETILNVVRSTVAAAQTDLGDLKITLENFENERVTKDTSVKQLEQRFPTIAKEIEGEIVRHEWFVDNDHGCT